MNQMRMNVGQKLLFASVVLTWVTGSYSIQTGDIRIVGSLHSNQGVLQIKTDNSWRWFCADHWTLGNAAVACRQLGFSAPLSLHPNVHFGSSADNVFSGVESSSARVCTGLEDRLENCPAGDDDYCYSMEDAVKVYCSADLPEIILDIRLRNDVENSPSVGGIVELLYKEAWHPICDDSFEWQDALIVCHQLGYADVSHLETGQHTGYTDENFILDDIECRGAERGISVCSHSGFFVHNCVSSEGAWVSCTGDFTTDEFQYMPSLSGEAGVNEGHLQIQDVNEMRPVCSDNIGWTEANIACRDMGFVGVESVPEPTELIPSGTEVFSINYCHGDEYTLTECDNNWFTTDCMSMRAASIKCVMATFPDWAQNEADCDRSDCQNGGFCVDHDPWDGAYVCMCPPGSYGHSCDEHDSYYSHYVDVRLADGHSPESGRVEVYYNGEWGTVCDDGWTTTNSEIVCRQLGYAGAKHYYNSPGYEYASILMDGVECNGHESSLADCYHAGFGNNDCSHYEDVGVECYYHDFYGAFDGGPLVIIGVVSITLLVSAGTYCKYRHSRSIMRARPVVVPEQLLGIHMATQEQVSTAPPQQQAPMAAPLHHHHQQQLRQPLQQPPPTSAYFPGGAGVPGPAVYQVPMITGDTSTPGDAPNITLPVS